MATINLEILNFEIEASEISLCTWDAGVLLDENGIAPDNLREEWAELDRYIREECEPDLNAEKIADLIHGGGWEIDDLERFIHVAVRALKLRIVTERSRATSEPITISMAG